MEGVLVSKIVDDVRICIDEITENDAETLFDEDTKELGSIIESKIEDSLRYVLLNADLSFLEPTVESLDGTVEGEGARYVSCDIDDDFLRFVSVKADCWLHHVSVPILSTDTAYAILKNSITTGHPDNPKAALILNEAKKRIELYGIPEDKTSVKVDLAYIKDAERSAEDKYEIPKKVYGGLIYHIAGATLKTFKDAHGDYLISQATQMIQ